MKAKPGDPSPRSPADVLSDHNYKMVSSEHNGGHVTLVVLHCGTETYWECVYHWNADKQPADWFYVVCEAVTVTKYRRV